MTMKMGMRSVRELCFRYMALSFPNTIVVFPLLRRIAPCGMGVEGGGSDFWPNNVRGDMLWGFYSSPNSRPTGDSITGPPAHQPINVVTHSPTTNVCCLSFVMFVPQNGMSPPPVC